MYPLYLMLTLLGFSTLYSGIMSLTWSREDLLNIWVKTFLSILTVFSGVGFYVTLATGYWMGFNAFTVIAGIFYVFFASITDYPLHRFMFWMLGIASLGNAVVAFAT